MELKHRTLAAFLSAVMLSSATAFPVYAETEAVTEEISSEEEIIEIPYTEWDFYGGGHDFTIVGYDDNFCCDINGDGSIETSEKGAFKAANSFGTDNSEDVNGYFWVMYDALNAVSANSVAIDANLSGTRVPAFSLDCDNYPTFWAIDVAHKDVYLVGELSIETTKFDSIQIIYGRNPSDKVEKTNDFQTYLHITQMKVFSDLQKILADYDHSGDININDVVAIQSNLDG